VVGWLRDLWDQIRGVPVGYIVAGLTFQTGHTGTRSRSPPSSPPTPSASR
jgi:hypothetical protein